MPLGAGVLNAFQVGQGLGQGQSALGHMVKQVVERFGQQQQVQGEAQLGLQKEQALIPLREASASRLLQEKARLFPQQPKALSGDTAGRLSLVTQGEKFAKRAKQLLFPTGEAGSFRRGLMGAANNPVGRTFGNPFGQASAGEAQDVEFYVQRAIDAQLRSETGAAAPPAELERMTKQFMANSYADPQAAFNRLTELEIGFQRTSTGIDPTGYYRNMGSSPFESRDEDLSSMSDEDILRGAGLM